MNTLSLKIYSNYLASVLALKRMHLLIRVRDRSENEHLCGREFRRSFLFVFFLRENKSKCFNGSIFLGAVRLSTRRYFLSFFFFSYLPLRTGYLYARPLENIMRRKICLFAGSTVEKFSSHLATSSFGNASGAGK